MLRLVKGAYWDTEIKRAQVDGLPGYPVFTRKVHTDVALPRVREGDARGARRDLSAVRDHNAFTIAAVHALAGDARYEFQCLHGMGESIYDQVVGEGKLDRAVPHLRAGRLARDAARLPRAAAARERRQQLVRQPHRRSGGHHRVAGRRSGRASPRRPAARRTRTCRCRPRCCRAAAIRAGVDLADDAVLRALARGARARRRRSVDAAAGCRRRSRPIVEPRRSQPPIAPSVGTRRRGDGGRRRTGAIGDARSSGRAVVAHAGGRARRVSRARRRSARSGARDASSRSRCAKRARRSRNAVAEVREAVDFLRYYAGEARALARRGADRARSSRSRRGIFRSRSSSGEVGAALAAGNPVLAKPAEQTPLIAREAVRVLHRAGVPRGRAAAPAGTRRDGRRGARRRSADRRRDLHRARPRSRGSSTGSSRRATTIRC